MLKLGKYRHYKGNEYEDLHVAKHTETEEGLVVYKAISDPEKVWVRPLTMFIEDVEIDGKIVPRFTYLGSE